MTLRINKRYFVWGKLKCSTSKAFSTHRTVDLMMTTLCVYFSISIHYTCLEFLYTGWTLQVSTFLLQSYHSTCCISSSKTLFPVLQQIFPHSRYLYVFNDILSRNFRQGEPESRVRETLHFKGKLYKTASRCSLHAARAARLGITSIEKLI